MTQAHRPMTHTHDFAGDEVAGTGIGSAWGGSSRREFLTLAAKGAAALGMVSTIGGCAIAAAGGRTFDFRDDFGVLNFAYALETLESRFYRKVCEAPPSDLRPGACAT